MLRDAREARMVRYGFIDEFSGVADPAAEDYSVREVGAGFESAEEDFGTVEDGGGADHDAVDWWAGC